MSTKAWNPLTVSAAPTMSKPSRIAEGKASTWIGVGELKPWSARAVSTDGGTNKLSQADMSERARK